MKNKINIKVLIALIVITVAVVALLIISVIKIKSNTKVENNETTTTVLKTIEEMDKSEFDKNDYYLTYCLDDETLCDEYTYINLDLKAKSISTGITITYKGSEYKLDNGSYSIFKVNENENENGLYLFITNNNDKYGKLYVINNGNMNIVNTSNVTFAPLEDTKFIKIDDVSYGIVDNGNSITISNDDNEMYISNLFIDGDEVDLTRTRHYSSEDAKNTFSEEYPNVEYKDGLYIVKENKLVYIDVNNKIGNIYLK